MANTRKRKKNHSAAPGVVTALMVLFLIGMIVCVMWIMAKQKKKDSNGALLDIAEQTNPGSASEVTTTEQTASDIQTTTTEQLPPGSVTGITLSFYSATMNPGDDPIKPAVTVLPENAEDPSVVWATSDPLVAEVDDSGSITPVGGGTCVIRVTSVNNPSVSADVRVTVNGKSTGTDPESTTPSEATSSSSSASASGATSQTAPPASSSSQSAVSSSKTTVTTVSASRTTSATVTTPAAQRDDIEVINGITYVQGVLIANKTYSLPSSYDPGALDPTALAAFKEMAAAAKKDGMTLNICSGYRSYAFQKQLYNNYCKRDGQTAADRYSARPGHSEHQTGLAMDINHAGSSFDKTPEAKWLAENCWKYGFIIRYPKGKEEITGYKYESWHVRYLGKDWAKIIYDSGLTLEEYFGITSKYAD